MNIRKALADFIIYHKVNNASDYTLSNYRRYVTYFANWLEEKYAVVDTDDLQLAHLREWVAHLQQMIGRHGQKLAEGTVHQYTLVLSIFCHWLEYEGVIEKPITTRFKLPKVEEKFIPTFTAEDIQKMLAVCEVKDKTKLHLCRALTSRNRAMVSVLIDTGIRRSELAGLRLCDVDRDMRVLLVRRKGKKWQQVPISREGFKALHEYLTKYRPILAREAGKTIALKEDAVFLTANGDGIAANVVSHLFDRIAKKAGIDGKKVSAHNCRRYMATTQLAMGRSPLDVQRQMGHTTLQMTNRYASLVVDQIQQSHEEYSPWRQRPSGDKNESEKTGYWDE